VQAVRASDVGKYTCMVTSPGGNETRSARLSVIELPFAPSNVKAERINLLRAVNVSWTPGFDGNSPIIKFIIQKREVTDIGVLFFDWFNLDIDLILIVKRNFRPDSGPVA
jgi:protein sidekick